MKNLFVFMMVSIDGYFAGPKGELDWHNVDAEFNEFAIRQLHEAGALVFGRRTYDLMASYWPSEHATTTDPIVAGLMNSLPKVVVSRTLNSADWNNTRVIGANAAAEITKLRNNSDKPVAIFGSSNLCVSLIDDGLIDEFRIIISPVVLGKGQIMFGGVAKQLKLKLMESRKFDSGNVLNYYRRG